MGLFSFFFKFCKPKTIWQGTPEMFLGMVIDMQLRNDKEYLENEAYKWGLIMQKIIKVNFFPYKDFNELMTHRIC